MTFLEEARHSLILIEHDPLLYEDAQSLRDAIKEAAVLLYSPGTDTFVEDMTRNAYFRGSVLIAEMARTVVVNEG